MEWIKCSDRLPEPESDYTTYLLAVRWDEPLVDKFKEDKKLNVWTGCYNLYNKVWVSDTDQSLIESDTIKVIAWMPLPEPPSE